MNFTNCNFSTDNKNTSSNQSLKIVDWTKTGTKIKNIVVSDCSFKTCYQGVYTSCVYNVKVTGTTFDDLYHNAIAIQNSELCNHGTIDIEKNNFNNCRKVIIRFGYLKEGTSVCIKNNNVSNFGSAYEPCNEKKYIIEGVYSSEVEKITFDLQKNWADTEFENNIVWTDRINNVDYKKVYNLSNHQIIFDSNSN